MRVAVAFENKNGIHGYRHGPPLEYTENLSGGDGPVVRSHHPLREEIAESVADHAENVVCD